MMIFKKLVKTKQKFMDYTHFYLQNAVFRIHIHRIQIRIRIQPKNSIQIRIQKGLESGSES